MITNTVKVLARTESVCPVCLARLPAERISDGDDVFLVKTCLQHGQFKTIIWRGLENYAGWGKELRTPSHPPVCESRNERGCPFDCGLCPEHRQHSCCVLLEVTQRCNLQCPVCFASAGGMEADPDISEIGQWLELLKRHGGAVNIQLSGGEPTVRDDLPEIVKLARSSGFDFVQVNTNGIRLARDTAYLRRLADAGLDCVFLQFDGVSDATYRRIRGADLMSAKQQAIANCAAHGLGVVLVPTLVPGVNTNEIGEIIDFAAHHTPAIRAVHFQPVSYFGRYERTPRDKDRITLPEVMREIERQTRGAIQHTDFHPGSAENAYCSFSGSFLVARDGSLRSNAPTTSDASSPTPTSTACGCGIPIEKPSTPQAAHSCCKPAAATISFLRPGERVQRARQSVAQQWKGKESSENVAPKDAFGIASLERFLAQRQHTLSISCMAFQDAWNLDLERLRECYIHVVSPDRRVIPFCAYNLTAQSGKALYRGVASLVQKEFAE